MIIVEKADHPVVGVHDLDAARAAFERLGFVVPPAGKHREWGTANVCIMFPDDYLEIRGVNDDSKFLAGLGEFLEHGEGFSGVAFSTPDAEASYQACIANGLEAKPPRELNRNLVLGDKTLSLHFKTMLLGHDLYPGLTHANLCEHLTPDILRQPGWIDHPNGAVGFSRLVGVVEDQEGARRTYERLLGVARVKPMGEHTLLDFERGAVIELIGPTEAARRGEAQPARAPAYMASATIAVKSIETTRALLSANGVKFTSSGNTVSVPPEQAAGARLHFEEVQDKKSAP